MKKSVGGTEDCTSKARWVNILYAEMMESVDMTDLKSVGHCGRVGSNPILGTTIAVCS